MGRWMCRMQGVEGEDVCGKSVGAVDYSRVCVQAGQRRCGVVVNDEKTGPGWMSGVQVRVLHDTPPSSCQSDA